MDYLQRMTFVMFDLLRSYHLGSNTPGPTLATGLAVWSLQNMMAKINFRRLSQLVGVSQKFISEIVLKISSSRLGSKGVWNMQGKLQQCLAALAGSGVIHRHLLL